MIDFKNSKIKIAKVGWLKVRGIREFKGKATAVTISRTPTGKYFISILNEDYKKPKKAIKIKPKTSVGIDLGLKDFVILSDGRKFKLPDQSNNYRKLEVLQKRASKKLKGGKNRKKCNLRVAKLHERIANKRLDFLHKLSYQLTHENQVKTIIVEDLNVKGMVKNRCLSKAISRSNWGEFIDMLKYKSKWYGRNFIQINRFEPTSKTCSNCGWVNNDLALADRVWTCKICDKELDRDINAALNIKLSGLSKPVESLEASGNNTGLLKEKIGV